MAEDPQDVLARWRGAYALERQWIDAQWENVGYWQKHDTLYWNWYYWPQFEWRSIRESL